MTHTHTDILLYIYRYTVEPLESGNPGMQEKFSIQMNLWNRVIGAGPSCFPDAPIPEVPLYNSYKKKIYVIIQMINIFTIWFR